MQKISDIQVGKAGEYITCADLIMKGLIGYPSEQGLPYDVVIDTGTKLLKCQVKTTVGPRVVPQRNKDSYAYIFNIKRHGKNGTKKYKLNDVDVFALVELENRSVGYLLNVEMPATLNLRIDSLRGSYYDEKGIQDYMEVVKLKADGLTNRGIARRININESTVGRMLRPDYKPHKTNATYFSDLMRGKEWFDGI